MEQIKQNQAVRKSEEYLSQSLKKSTEPIQPIQAVENVFNYEVPRIYSFEKEVADNEIMKILIKNIGLSGLKEEHLPDGTFVFDDIKMMIWTVFKHLSFGDINLAFNMDRYGQLGKPEEHFYNFDTAYVQKILAKFDQWRKDEAVSRNVKPKEIAPTKTQEEIKKEDAKFFQSILDDLKAGKPNSDVQAYLYYERLPNRLLHTDEQILASKFYSETLTRYRSKAFNITSLVKDGILRRKAVEEKKNAEQELCLIECKNHITCEFLKFKYLKNK